MLIMCTVLHSFVYNVTILGSVIPTAHWYYLYVAFSAITHSEDEIDFNIHIYTRQGKILTVQM